MKGRRLAGKDWVNSIGRKTGKQQTGKEGETIDRKNERKREGNEWETTGGNGGS
jgi:hypothetical protein